MLQLTGNISVEKVDNSMKNLVICHTRWSYMQGLRQIVLTTGDVDVSFYIFSQKCGGRILQRGSSILSQNSVIFTVSDLGC